MKKSLFLGLPAASIILISGAFAQTATPSLPDTKPKIEVPKQEKSTSTEKSDEKEDKETEKPVESKDAATEKPDIQKSTEAYNAGIKALEKNDFAAAAKHFTEAVQISPSDASANLYLGYVKLKQDDWKGALTALEQSKEHIDSLDKSLHPTLWNNLGLAYAKTDQADKALDAYQKALSLDKDYVDARYNLAFAQLSKKDYKGALSNLRLLRDQNKDDAAFQTAIYNGLATAYEGLKDNSNALGAYRKVVQLNRNDVDSLFNFALALRKAGRTDEAIRQLNTLLKLRSTHSAGLSLLGNIYLRQGNWDDAAKTFKRYADAHADEFDAWFNLGASYDHANQFDEALEAYIKAESIKPEDTSVKNNIGRIYFKQEKYDDATAKLQEALKVDASFNDARLNLGLVLMAQEKWDEAAKEWRTYLANLREQLAASDITSAEKKEIARRGADAHSALALCYMHQEMYADALGEYKQLLVANPNDEDAKINLALCYYHTRNYTESLKINREVTAANPQSAIAFNNLGVTLEALNRVGEAVENYKKALKIDPDYRDAQNNLKRLDAQTVTG